MLTKNKGKIAKKQEKLQELLEWFSSDEFNVDEAIEKFSEAQKISSEIESILQDQENKINEIKNSLDL